MAFSEKIKLIFDIDDGPGVKSLKNLRTSVNDADGAFGKAKAGAGGLATMVKENMGAAALAGGAALIAFGVKAVGAFTDAAKAAIDLSTATGLSTEEASRWIAIGDDYQVSAEQLTGSLGKIAKTLDDTKWSEYGVATRDAGGNALSTNVILLDAFDMLGKIENATERARVGNELFGKGYSNLAPLIGETKDEYKGMLDAVSSGQVITAKEAQKAERMRLAQDALNDALQDVTLAVGGFVAEMAPMIEDMSDATTKATELVGALGPLPQVLEAAMNPLGLYNAVLDASVEKIDLATISLEDLIAKLQESGFSQAQITELTLKWKAANEEAVVPVEELVKAVEAVTAASIIAEGKASSFGAANRAMAIKTKEAEDATRLLEDAVSDLQDEISDESSFIKLQDTYDAYIAKQGDAEASDRDKRQSSLDVKAALVDQLTAIENIPDEKKTEILTLIDQEKYDEAIWALGAIPTEVKVRVNVQSGNIKYEANAAGRIGGPAGLSLVGEQGPELTWLEEGQSVASASKTQQMLSGRAVTQNVYGPGWGVASRQNMLMDAGRLAMMQRGARRRA